MKTYFRKLLCSTLIVGQLSPAFGMERPDEHICPITFEVMRHPVLAADGHTYEREALEAWVSQHGTSPLTRDRLNAENLVPNRSLLRLIETWKPGVAPKAADLEGLSADALAAQVRAEFAKSEALLTPEQGAKDRHIVAFLGNTGAGKSTLINWLSGKDLQVSDDGEDYVLVHPEDPTAMEIGLGGESQTVYPKSIDVGDLRLFDLPGFNDTDSARNLVNAAFIRRILGEAATVRLVFVGGQDQFTADRGTSIKTMFQALQNLFVTEGENLVDQGVFVATKLSCNPSVDVVPLLLKRTDSRDKEALNRQLQAWHTGGRIAAFYHANRNQNTDDSLRKILKTIQDQTPSQIRGVT